MLKAGVYEQVVNAALARELDSVEPARKALAPIDPAEAAEVMSQYLADVARRGLENVLDIGGDIAAQVELANRIVALIESSTQEADFASLGIDRRAEQLLALLRENDPRLAAGRTAEGLERPETSLARSSLFTGAVHEPQMYTELKREIASADRIDMLVSFIKWSGLRLIMDALREFAERGGELRVITTSYMGATDVKAIEELSALPNAKIKVSYDTKRTRLHAKAYVFYRETGFTTAYVGSANLSNAAISSGLEWNVKVTRGDLPETMDKIEATFESYWNSGEFEYYTPGQRERLSRALKDANFGELFVGGSRPDSAEHIFMSIQTFNSQGFDAVTASDFYDYIVVDEFHHAAAPTYKRLLEHYRPKIMLGLTATPERMDGKSILDYFDGRIAAEIRLPEAIERRLLCPFQYFGVTDTVDLSRLRWSRGGYDKAELTNVYALSGAAAERRAEHVLRSLLKYVTDIDDVKGLGFCASVEHARFMCDFFNRRGVPALCLSGRSPEDERRSAKLRLVSGEVRFIFVVDIYNEGVDIPEVNTVLFLRPTESLTVFLQQLGRGLRLAEGKDCLTVLDFIGQANKRYSFEEKFAALLTNTTRGVVRELQRGFSSAPKGCYIQLEKLAARYVLDNIRASYGRMSGLVARAASFAEDTGRPLTLANFLDYYRLDPRSVYKFASFSRICARAGVRESFAEPMEETLSRAFVKLAAIDSRRWIRFLLEILPKLDDTDFAALSGNEKRMLQMFYITVWGRAADWGSEEMLDNLYALSDSEVMLEELIELLRWRYEQIDFVDAPLEPGFDCPLDLHCTYTRDQIFAALDYMTPGNLREGVKWLPDKQLDVLLITLNKSDKDYSPTTMYRDYSINERLFHWQSQSTTSSDSPTGQRYIHHRERGSRVLLFVREYKTDPQTASAAPYTCLGTASYITHTGSRPMNITWQLDNPIPAKYLKQTVKLVG